MWGEGKGEKEEKDLGVEQFRECSFFVLRWIGFVSQRELGAKRQGFYSLNQDFADPNAPAYFAETRFHCL